MSSNIPIAPVHKGILLIKIEVLPHHCAPYHDIGFSNPGPKQSAKPKGYQEGSRKIQDAFEQSARHHIQFGNPESKPSARPEEHEGCKKKQEAFELQLAHKSVGSRY
jgi:hypothetical protein